MYLAIMFSLNQLFWILHFLLTEQTNCLHSEFNRQFISDLTEKYIYLMFDKHYIFSFII